ncbi:site-specific integrase [Desulforamulus putei]|uniref:tyrosine-type recombinase/integrase n=1 Tax=Desulforamulus putei TaxID=74701 RepID=UPI002FDD5FCF
MAQIRERKPGVFTISVYLGKDNDGKKKFHHETFKGKLRAAQQRARILEANKDSLKGSANQEMILAKYLDYWLEMTKKTVTERTWETYEYHVKKLKPLIGDIRLSEIRVLTLQERLVYCDLSARTVKGIYGTLRTAIRQAIAWGLIDRDVTSGLKPPRNSHKERRILNSEELHKLLAAAKGYKHYALIRLLAVTGMRLGEAAGLKWRDIDFEKETVTIYRSADTRKRKMKDEPKNLGSRRRLQLDGETLEALKKHKKSMESPKVANIRQEDELVFHQNGRPLNGTMVRRALDRALRRAGLPHIRVHDLRHGAGSLMLDAGFSLPSVSSVLGHSTPATTAAIYLHAVKTGTNVIDALKKSENQSEKISNTGR